MKLTNSSGNTLGESLRFYRRGAIMGLTVAETFILMVFALLLIFTIVFGIGSEDDELPTTEQVEPEPLDPITQQIVNLLEPLRLDERQQVLEYIPNIESINQLRENFAEIENLFQNEEQRQEFVDALSELDDETRIRLIGWLQTDDFEEALNDQDDAAESVDSQDEESLSMALQSIISDIDDGFEVSIGDAGVISLNNAQAFASNDSTLTRESIYFLDRFCPEFFEQLFDSGVEIEDVRVEGHSSSEWGGTTSNKQAWLNNLTLSSARASAVVQHCLDAIEDPEIFEWATKRITTVGFSSSRLILDENGNEDQESSRRVDFSYIVSYDE